VVNLADWCIASVAEHALGLLLTLAHRIHLAHDRFRGLAPPTTSLRGFELTGRTLGVVGLGRIGSRVAASGRALGVRVIATDPRLRPAGGVPPRSLPDLLRAADAVTLHVPATFQAAPLIGAASWHC
jgi:phosphoglycerate dehydrogenase-like enzyme